MNRVRVVAATAVVLGVAVVAGTRFQESRGLGPSASPQIAAAPAPQVSVLPDHGLPPAIDGAQDLASVSLPDAGASARAPVSLMPAAPQPASVVPEARRPEADAARDAPRAAPQLTTASILSAADLVSADSDGASDPAPVDAAGPADPLDESLRAELAACSIWVVVTPAQGAMLETSVYAPCDRGADVRVDHAGLTFDTRVGMDGQLMLMVPALVDEATVTVNFADGRSQSDTTLIPDLRGVERVALQWAGPAELALHAYEFGARFGDDGHIHAGNPLAPGAEGHGFLTVLGDPGISEGHRVQVYSYPSGQPGQSGSVALEIEAPITDASCGKPLVAESIEMSGAAAARIRAIRLDMPACDGTGGYVVLPGVLPDLQIAALR